MKKFGIELTVADAAGRVGVLVVQGEAQWEAPSLENVEAMKTFVPADVLGVEVHDSNGSFWWRPGRRRTRRRRR